MKLTIAITDACIFIDLFDLELIHSFFNLKLEIHTTVGVFYEINEPQKQDILTKQQADGALIIHNLQEEDFIEISSENYPLSLSETDKSVLHLANKLNACVLSSDKVLRNYAKNKLVECHGLIWIFDELVKSKILKNEEAVDKLSELVTLNIMFRNNKNLVTEINNRIKRWSEV